MAPRDLLSCGLHPQWAHARLLLGRCPGVGQPHTLGCPPHVPSATNPKVTQASQLPRLHFLQIKQITSFLWTKHSALLLLAPYPWGLFWVLDVQRRLTPSRRTPANSCPSSRTVVLGTPRGNLPCGWYRLSGVRTFSQAPGDPDDSTELLSLQKCMRVPFRPRALLCTVSSKDPTDPTPQAHLRLGQERGWEQGLQGGCRRCP